MEAFISMQESVLAKIMKYAKDGTLLQKVATRYQIIYYINNRNARYLARQSRVYETLNRQYKDILNKGIENQIESRQSDYVWICWFQGIENAPPLVRACFNSVKTNVINKKIMLITDENIDKFVRFPTFIKEKRKKGIIPDAHYSDLVRCELLCKYGGMWCDATVLCTGSVFPEYISGLPLFVFKEMDLTRIGSMPAVASNWLISAQNNQRILLMTRKLLHEYWKREDTLKHYFIFHMFFAMSSRKYEDDWCAIPMFNNHTPHTLMFELGDRYSEERWKQILNMCDFHKLNHHIDYLERKDTFYYHILKEYLP